MLKYKYVLVNKEKIPMLLTKTLPIHVPLIFLSRFNILSYELRSMLAEYTDISESFHEDFCQFISEFYLSFEKKNFTYTTKIIEQFYTKWIESSQFPTHLRTTLEHAITAALTSLIVFNLGVELAYVSHYSLAISCGLTLLFISVGIKITTPEWSSVGILSGGMFKYRIFKTSPTSKNTHRKTLSF